MSTLYANLGAAAAAVILLLLRRVLKKRVPPGVFAALWLLVLVRVLIPVEVTTHISVFPAKAVSSAYVNEGFEHGEGTADFAAPQYAAQTAEKTQNSAQNGVCAERPAQSNRKTDFWQVFSALHIGGAVLLAAYFGIGHVNMLRRCNSFEHEKSDAANAILQSFDKSGRIALLTGSTACSPFSIGIIKPKIVLPPDCKKEQFRFILAHEYVHIRYRDAAVRLVGLAAVCAGWFNPFVWIAFRYLDRDLERFCDERALRLLGAENAPRYALTLLDFAERQMKSTVVHSFAAAPLEERVNDILSMNIRKTSTLLAALTVAAALLAMTACGTAALAEETPQEDDNYIWTAADHTPVGHKTVQEKYSVNHRFYRPITGETMCTIGISLDYSFDGLSSKIDDYRITRKVENGYILSLTPEISGDTLTIDAECITEDGKIFVHDVITVKTYPDSNVVKSHSDERTPDEEITGSTNIA